MDALTPARQRRFSVRREIVERCYAQYLTNPVVVTLTCGHRRSYYYLRQPKIGAKVACQECAPKEIR